MGGAKDDRDAEQPVDPAELGFVAEVLKDMQSMPIHPFMAHPTATMVAATALGLGIATQMTSAWLGSLQGAIEASARLGRKPDGDEPQDHADHRTADREDKGPGSLAEASVEVDSKSPVVVQPNVSKAQVKPKAKVQARVKVPTGKRTEAQGQPALMKTVSSDAQVGKAASASPSAKVAVAKTPTSAKASGKPDDLKRIDGIGPKLEQILNKNGIRRIADLAALSEAEMAAMDAELGLDGRALRDDWLGQAKAFGTKRK